MPDAPETPQTARPLPRWLWLWTAPIVVGVQVLARALDADGLEDLLRGERGVVENLTVVFLVVACVAAVRLYRLRAGVASRLFGPFAVVMAVGCFFFAGEELSWGQHWLGFEPSEAISARNDQGEFNLHNDPVLGSLLDQPARNLLTLAALVGGVVAPLVRRRRRLAEPRFAEPGPWGWIWPTLVCVPSATLALVVTAPKKLFAALDREVPSLLDITHGETKEMCLALFLLVYLETLRRSAVGDQIE